MNKAIVKDFLGIENARNKRHAALYIHIMQLAMGATTDVLIGHHLCFETDKDINTENEIPSADTLLFDHGIMTAVFGDRALEIMSHLAVTPSESRDEVLKCYVEELDGGAQQTYPASGFTVEVTDKTDIPAILAGGLGCRRSWPSRKRTIGRATSRRSAT